MAVLPTGYHIEVAALLEVKFPATDEVKVTLEARSPTLANQASVTAAMLPIDSRRPSTRETSVPLGGPALLTRYGMGARPIEVSHAASIDAWSDTSQTTACACPPAATMSPTAVSRASAA